VKKSKRRGSEGTRGKGDAPAQRGASVYLRDVNWRYI